MKRISSPLRVQGSCRSSVGQEAALDLVLGLGTISAEIDAVTRPVVESKLLLRRGIVDEDTA